MKISIKHRLEQPKNNNASSIKIGKLPTNQESYPCADYKPGEDDLQNFDFIRKFMLDVNLDGYPGVSAVRGSDRTQTAYRIDSAANLAMPTL